MKSALMYDEPKLKVGSVCIVNSKTSLHNDRYVIVKVIGNNGMYKCEIEHTNCNDCWFYRHELIKQY